MIQLVLPEGNSLPVVAGLSVGIAFVIGFSFFVQYTNFGIIRVVPVIAIPEGAGNMDSAVHFDPESITVQIGFNNTVRWSNHDKIPYWIAADSDADPAFWNATNSSDPNNPHYLFILPDHEFEFTFNKVGEFGYHAKPWMAGKVIVLPNPSGLPQ